LKFIVKLLIAALIANAAWHVMSAYASFWKFKDAVAQTTQFGNDKSVAMLKNRILQLATEYDLPVDDNSFTVTRSRESLHTVVDGSYTREIELVPGYSRPWPFPFHIDTFSDAPMTGDGR
jgi:hypothetical protein